MRKREGIGLDGRTEMNIASYLARIDLGETDLGANIESLRLLQRSHLLAVPFENLDIHWKRPITLDTARFFEKVVGEKRGGFCYELNGLFNELLVSLGFKTRLISARVFNGTIHGPEYDHAAIIVTIGEHEYLADVGFGDFSAEPLKFVLDEKQADTTGIFVIRRFHDDHFEVAKRDSKEWKSQYIFKDVARDLSEFAKMCDFQQYSPESHFTKGKLISIMTPSGRKTLTDKRFIVTERKDRHEIELADDNDFDVFLQNEFDIILRLK